MAISALGSKGSPVRIPFNLWMLAILSFKMEEKISGMIGIVSFVLALTFFVLFVMSDKAEFQGTVIAKEGLWQRLNLLFTYLPLFYVAITKIKS